MRARFWTATLLGLALPLLAAPEQPRAHPHVWVTVETKVLYGPERSIVGLRQKWVFDEFYSAFAAQGLDGDGDGKLSRKELHPLAEENVSSLKDFGYFTFVKASGKSVERLDPRDYHLEHADGILTLHFTLPLKTPLDGRSSRVTFSVYDPTYFVAFSFAKERPVTLAAAAPKGCEPRMVGQKTANVDVARLGEAFFSQLDATSDFGAQFASSVAIHCPKS